MIEILFLLGFSLHNLEEALWLPKWSEGAGRYHRPVSENEFRFAVIVVTALGYVITLQYFLLADIFVFSRFLYLGFVSMMMLNVIFPHLAATFVLRRYAPGLITGILLNVPIGSWILFQNLAGVREIPVLLLVTALLAGVFIGMINLLFRAGRKLIG